jgi:hypothetical protein
MVTKQVVVEMEDSSDGEEEELQGLLASEVDLDQMQSVETEHEHDTSRGNIFSTAAAGERKHDTILHNCYFQKLRPTLLWCAFFSSAHGFRTMRRVTTILVALGVMVCIYKIALFFGRTLRHHPHHAQHNSHHWNPLNHSSSITNWSSLLEEWEEKNSNANRTKPSVPYRCPLAISTKAANDKDHAFDVYAQDTKLHMMELLHGGDVDGDQSSILLDNLLHETYGAWGITPLQRKALTARWVHWYAEALLNNNNNHGKSLDESRNQHPKTIYESACGVGLSLLVLLQLLQERYNITGLEVYGNEYILDNVITGNWIYRQLLVLAQQTSSSLLQVQTGRICQGDSTNLSYVPSNAFDVVFTGYIDPIVDPLELKWTRAQYQEYCRSSRSNTKTNTSLLLKQEQQRVEDWYAKWVGEMIRIAKPGATIVVETISVPKCRMVKGWGGVARKWWKDSVQRSYYSWSREIDPTSIEIIDFDPDRTYSQLRNRYNVKMIKII